MDSVLRPRDIQARIRAGEAPEDVAAAAQTSVDKIMGFATPVLAERAYQAQLAQRASVRRRAAAGQVGNLGTAVTHHLEGLDVDPETVEWDAWRREDGRWTVVAAYQASGEHRQAAFAYDSAGRFVIAEDDEARALVGERSTVLEEPPVTHTPPAPAGSALDDLLAPHEEPAGEQLPLGDDAISLVAGRRPEETDAPEPVSGPVVQARPEPQGEVTIDLTDATSTVRAAGPATSADADWISTQASERPAPPAPQPEEVPGSEQSDAPGDGETVEGDAREEEKEAMTLFEVPPTQPDAPASEASDAPPAADVPDAPQRPARAARSRGRASVPSWDEIMFGTPSSE